MGAIAGESRTMGELVPMPEGQFVDGLVSGAASPSKQVQRKKRKRGADGDEEEGGGDAHGPTPMDVAFASPMTELAMHAKGVLEAVEFAGLAMITKDLPDADLHRVGEAITRLADHLHGNVKPRSHADETALRAAVQSATRFIDGLGSRHQRQKAELRAKLNAVHAVLQSGTTREAAKESPTALLHKAEETEAMLGRWKAFAAAYQHDPPPQPRGFDRLKAAGEPAERALVGLDTDGIDDALASTRGWVARIQQDPGDAEALARAIVDQHEVVTMASAELRLIIEQPVTATTTAVIADYLAVLAISGGRRARSDAALEVARVRRRRMPLDRAAAALEQGAAQAHRIDELDPGDGQDARAVQQGLTQQYGELEQRIADGEVVDPDTLDEFVLETREHEFLNRVDLLRLDARQLHEAVGALGGARTPEGVQIRGRLDDLVAEMAGVRMRYSEFAFSRDDRTEAAKRARKREHLRVMEAQLKVALEYGKYEATLERARQIFDDLVVHRMISQLMWTVALTVAGNFAAAAVRGAGQVALMEAGLSLANAGRIAHVVAVGVEGAWGAGVQKGMGDEASFGTLLAVNLITPLAIDRVMAVGRSSERAADGAANVAARSERLLEEGADAARGAASGGADDVVSAAARLDRAAKKSVWVRNAQRGGLVLQGGVRLTAEMVVGAAVDYATRMAAGEANGRAPDEQTASEWLMQGASMAIGRHLSVNVKAIQTRLKAVETVSGAAASRLLGTADGVAKDLRLLESGDQTLVAADVVERYATLVAEERAILERELAATIDGHGTHGERKLMSLLEGNQRTIGELGRLASGETHAEADAGEAGPPRPPRSRPPGGGDGDGDGPDVPPPQKDGDDDGFDPRWLTPGQERVRDWQLQELAGQRRGKAMLADPEFRLWFERWMSMPDKVTFEGETSTIRYPEGTPPRIRARLEQVARAGNLVRMSSAVELGQQLRAEFPDVDLDPTSDSWRAARPKLIERFGEREVGQYEQRFAGSVTVGAASGQTRVRQLIETESLNAMRAMFPSAEVYVSGPATEGPLHLVTKIDVIVVVADNTSVAVRAEFEGNANHIGLRTQGETADSYREAVRSANATQHGSTPVLEIFPVDAKVMTRSEFAGWSMQTVPVGGRAQTDIRVDTPNAGPGPGRGETGVDVHNHIMGVPKASYFVDQLSKNGSVAALDRTWQIVNDESFWKPAPDNAGKVREVKNTIMAELAEARADLANLGDKVPASAGEARARRALEAVLAASDSVPFDHTYDLRDLLVQAVIDPGGGPFRNAATDTVRDLHEEGISYSEQSVSIKKLDTRFDEATMREVHAALASEGKDSDLRFLAMLSTKDVLSGEPLPPQMQVTLDRVLARADVMGLDIAGPEAQAFTRGGVQNLARLIQLLRLAATKRGRPLVLRPHVGEGYDPAGTGDHVALARDNLQKTLNALIQAGYQGPGDGVIVRFGHAAHATPDQLQQIADLGIVVEANVGSNLATGSVTAASDHPILLNLYYGVDTMLSTDGQGVMETTLSIEYQRAAQLIGLFQAGKTRLHIDGKEVAFHDLPSEVQRRFALETLEDTARAYAERQRADDARDRARRPAPTTPGAPR